MYVCVVRAVASQGASYLTSPAVTAAHAQELAAAGGIITAQELARAQPLERELLTVQVGKHMQPHKHEFWHKHGYVRAWELWYGKVAQGATNAGS